MNYKYSGNAIYIIDKDTADFEDVNMVAERLFIRDDIDFDRDIFEYFKTLEEFNKLEDGIYNIYFDGTITYEESYSWEYGVTEYDSYVSVNYYYIEKLE